MLSTVVDRRARREKPPGAARIAWTYAMCASALDPASEVELVSIWTVKAELE